MSNHSPYATEAERLEARRKTWRESKERKAKQTQERKAAAEAWVEQLINSGTGPAYRRALMLDILKRNPTCTIP
jgi:hypothetical protein